MKNTKKSWFSKIIEIQFLKYKVKMQILYRNYERTLNSYYNWNIDISLESYNIGYLIYWQKHKSQKTQYKTWKNENSYSHLMEDILQGFNEQLSNKPLIEMFLDWNQQCNWRNKLWIPGTYKWSVANVCCIIAYRN